MFQSDTRGLFRHNRRPAVVPFLILLLLICGTVPAAAADGASPLMEPPALLRLVDQPQTYTIGFLWFDRVAEGTLSLQRDNIVGGRYRAIMEARTRGTSAWLTGDRVQRYETVMELTPSGRLRPLEHRSHVEKGKAEKRTIQTKLYRFDAEGRSVEVRRIKDGQELPVNTIKLQHGESAADFLTAFFNFSLGVYGEVKEGGIYRIPTLTRKGETTIEATVLAAEQRSASAFFRRGGVVLKIMLDPEVLDTAGGAVYMQLDDSGRLERGIVENVLGLGNVKGIRR